MSGIDKNFDIFGFLQTILSHFPTEVCKQFFKSLFDYVMGSHLLNVYKHSDSKRIQKVHISCIKARMLKFFDSFRSVFEAKRCNLVPKNVLRQNAFICFWLFEFQGQFEAFCFTNWTYLLTKAHQNNKIHHSSVVLTFSVTKSINCLRKIEGNQWNSENFRIFVFFDVNSRQFSNEKLHVSLIKHTGQHIFSLWTLLIIPIYDVCRQLGKIQKTLKVGKFWGFLSISVLIWDLFHFENNIQLFIKASGQWICALLNVFNILIHGVFRKIDENSIKTIKIGNLYYLSIYRSALDNKLVPCWTLSTF